MVGEGFEPSKAQPPDLQSGPFDRSGTPPKSKQVILSNKVGNVNSLAKYLCVYGGLLRIAKQIPASTNCQSIDNLSGFY